MGTVYQLSDLIPREVVRRIIDSDRTKEQMLGMLDCIPTLEQAREEHLTWACAFDSNSSLSD